MATIRAEVTAIVPAPADDIYDVIADYRDGHPHILPERYFSDLQVVRGGYGAGTEIRFRMRLLGETRDAYGIVGEPEPGRVISESYPDTGAVTTFVVEPLENASSAAVTIRTEWSTAGLRGLVERALVPRMLSKVFVAELDQLARFVATRRSS